MKTIVLSTLISLLSLLPAAAQSEVNSLPSETLAIEAKPSSDGSSNATLTSPLTANSESPKSDPSQASLVAVATSPSSPSEEASSSSSSPQQEAETNEPDFLQRTNMILAKLLENKRALDPFGMPMDPANVNASQALADQYPELAETTTSTTKTDSPSLQNALGSLTLTGIYPQKNLLVIGGRQFSVGDVFGLNWEDQMMRLRFEGIRSGKLYFKDLETSEVASIPFNAPPAGFIPMKNGQKEDAKTGIIPMSKLFIVN